MINHLSMVYDRDKRSKNIVFAVRFIKLTHFSQEEYDSFKQLYKYSYNNSTIYNYITTNNINLRECMQNLEQQSGYKQYISIDSNRFNIKKITCQDWNILREKDSIIYIFYGYRYSTLVFVFFYSQSNSTSFSSNVHIKLKS